MIFYNKLTVCYTITVLIHIGIVNSINKWYLLLTKNQIKFRINNADKKKEIINN